MTPKDPLFTTSAFSAAAELEGAISSAVEVAAEYETMIHGPAEIGGGKLLLIWPPPQGPSFVSVRARLISDEVVRVGVTAQALEIQGLDMGERICATLEARLGTLGPGVLPPPRIGEYDREATRLLEAEIQGFLEAMAVEPAAWGQLATSIFERELQLQHLTELRA